MNKILKNKNKIIIAIISILLFFSLLLFLNIYKKNNTTEFGTIDIIEEEKQGYHIQSKIDKFLSIDKPYDFDKTPYNFITTYNSYCNTKYNNDIQQLKKENIGENKQKIFIDQKENFFIEIEKNSNVIASNLQLDFSKDIIDYQKNKVNWETFIKNNATKILTLYYLMIDNTTKIDLENFYDAFNTWIYELNITKQENQKHIIQKDKYNIILSKDNKSINIYIYIQNKKKKI